MDERRMGELQAMLPFSLLVPKERVRHAGDGGCPPNSVGEENFEIVEVIVRKETPPCMKSAKEVVLRRHEDALRFRNKLNVTSWSCFRCSSAVVRVIITERRLNPEEGGERWLGIRIKQHLVSEFSPSGYTHAALCPPYGQPECSSLVDRITIPLFHADDSNRPAFVCGTDYGGCYCAAGVLFGTQVELRIEDSSDLEPDWQLLLRLAGTLAPVVYGISFRVYAESLYLARYPSAKHNYRGPTSLFAFKWNYGMQTTTAVKWRRASLLPHEDTRLPGEEAIELPGRLPVEIALGDDYVYTINSVGILYKNTNDTSAGGPGTRGGMPLDVSHVKEVLVLYQSPSKHCHIWIRAFRTRSFSFGAGRFPLHASYPRVEQIRIDSGTEAELHLACVAEDVGAWEAGWRAQRPGFVCLVQASPSIAATKASFSRLARSLLLKQLF